MRAACFSVAVLFVMAKALSSGQHFSLTTEGATWPTKPFWRISSYLSQFGLDAGENELSLSFDDGRVRIHDGAAHLYGGYRIMPIDNAKSGGFLRIAGGPNVTWPAVPGMKYMVIFTDMGPANGELEVAGPIFFPFIHSFWYGCTGGSLITCARGPEPFTNTPEGYTAPGNYQEVANRYTFLLFEAPTTAAEVSMGGLRGAALSSKLADIKEMVLSPSTDQMAAMKSKKFLMSFDFGKFAAENPDYKIARWNYMMINARK